MCARRQGATGFTARAPTGGRGCRSNALTVSGARYGDTRAGRSALSQ
jgi:hypothetical protein